MAPKDDESGAAPDESGFNVSRRAFLKTVGASSVAATVVGGGAEAQTSGATPMGPGPVPITLTINGKKHQLTIEPRVTLLDAMRDRLDHTGLKRVCDRGTCGACTAIVDGRTAYTCSMLAIEAQGKEIRTVEGLTQGTVLHPVQQAFVAHDGTMCGFCTPGLRDVGRGAAREASDADARTGPRSARRQHLPLRHLHARARSRARSEEGGGPWLTRSRKCRRRRARNSMRSTRGPGPTSLPSSGSA